MNKRIKKKTRIKLDCEHCDEEVWNWIIHKCEICKVEIVICEDCRRRNKWYCKQCEENIQRDYNYGG